MIVVDPGSADPRIGKSAVPIDADHRSIAKPRSTGSEIYRAVDRLIAALTAEADAPSGPADVAVRISGDWWGRVITPGHESALACIHIGRHRETGAAFLEGRSFDLDGALVAEWKSKITSVERSRESNAILFSYTYAGERVDQPGKILLFGHADIRFREPVEHGAIERGDGDFIGIYPSDAAADDGSGQSLVYGTATRRKQELVRAVEADDVATLRSAVDPAKCRSIVRRILSEVWQVGS